MRTVIRVATVLAVCAWASVAAAQTASPGEWSRGTTLSGFGGFGGDGSRTGPLFGGTVAWDVSSRVAIEGSGAWAHFERDADAFAGSLKTRINLFRSRRAIPFVGAGIGLYRTSFEPGARMPAFYARRMPAAGMRRMGSTFTDPRVVFGGGLNVAITRVMPIRPDVDVGVVFRDSRAYTVPAVRLHLVFVFEDHPVTPARRRR